MGGTSQKKIEANRRNAQRSTGPRTEAGKRRSRANRLRHGLAAEVIVTEAEAAAYEEARLRWRREAGPDNVVEQHLIDRAAVASVRLDRIERANQQAREAAAREAVGRWGRRMQARARKAGQRLRVDPVGAVEELEATAFGCEWLIRRWRALEAKLRQGWAWGRDDVHAAQLLLGLPVMVPGPCAEPASRRLWGLAARANPAGVEEPPPSPSGDQDAWPRKPGEAWAALFGFVAEQVGRLAGLRDEAWEEAEGPECAALARLAAAADTSPEGRLRHRYEAAADRSCNAAIRLFLNLRDRRRKELLAIAKEAAAIGDTPKAPVGGGWWRQADSDPAPPGFARLDPTSDLAPASDSGSPSSATPTAPVPNPDALAPESPVTPAHQPEASPPIAEERNEPNGGTSPGGENCRNLFDESSLQGIGRGGRSDDAGRTGPHSTPSGTANHAGEPGRSGRLDRSGGRDAADPALATRPALTGSVDDGEGLRSEMFPETLLRSRIPGIPDSGTCSGV